MSDVSVLSCLEDNYMYVLCYGSDVILVDASDARVALDHMKKSGLAISHILITHHHSDHIDGLNELKLATDAKVLGPDDARLVGVNESLRDKQSYFFHELEMKVLLTPGHTRTHLCYYFPKLKVLFSGDTLFGCGAGRLFEGAPKAMFDSLQKISLLPDDTKVYCGHEYTEKNIEFALSVDPDNEALKRRHTKVKALREDAKTTMPSTLGEEKETNPFLRCEDQNIRKQLNLSLSDANEKVFAELRMLKDTFR